MHPQFSKSAESSNKNDAPVAQLVEHLTLNQGVQGSSPCGCTTKEKANIYLLAFLFLLFFVFIALYPMDSQVHLFDAHHFTNVIVNRCHAQCHMSHRASQVQFHTGM